MRSKLSALASFGVLASATAVASAGYAPIDEFTTAPPDTYPVIAPATNQTPYAGYEYAGDILSGVRYVELNRAFGTPTDITGQVRLAIGDATASGSSLEYSAPDRFAAQLLLIYAFVPPGPDVPALNFADSDGFVIRIDQYASTNNAPLSVRAEVYDNFGEVWSQTVGFATTSTGGEVFIPFSSFQLVDFTNIDDLVFQFDIPAGVALTIDSVGTRIVPSPGAMLIATAASPLATRRRRSARA